MKGNTMKEIKYFSVRTWKVYMGAMWVLAVGTLVGAAMQNLWLMLICLIGALISPAIGRRLFRCPHCHSKQKLDIRKEHLYGERTLLCTQCGGKIKFR